jgi:hypothetical protein
MFLLARYTVAAAVFLSASAASAVEDATLSADRMLPACTAFIRDRAPGDVDGVFAAGRCIGLMQGTLASLYRRCQTLRCQGPECHAIQRT